MAAFVSSLALSILVFSTMYFTIETATRGDCAWWSSWLQFLGLAVVGCWSAWRLYDVLNGSGVTPQQLLAHCGMAAYALGHSMERWRSHDHPMHGVIS